MSRNLKSRVAAAATEALARQGFVTPVDVCVGIGWLDASNVDDWRRGRVDDLADLLPVPGDRITEFIVCLDSLRGSGRVGRSAAGRSLDEEALTLAVVASVRHEDTDYDLLLMSGISRHEARDQIRETVDRVLASWS
jgi:hypothetical protein